MKKLILAVAVIALAAGLYSCGGSSGGGGGGGTGTAMAGLASCTASSTTQGVVCGQVLAADGTTPLSGAEVRLSDASAQTLSSVTTKGVENSDACYADTSGNFACLVPAGTVGTTNFIIIFTGFANGSFSADITAGATTDAGAQTLTGDTSAQWVVVPGAYDGVQVLLSQLKGCTLDDGAGGAFDPATMNAEDARASTDCTDKGLLVLSDDPSAATWPPTWLVGDDLANYHSLFINCSANYSGSDGVDAAIQAFSAAGGHIYFSDLSDTWLTAAFPGQITYLGNSTSRGSLSASVPYAALATAVGDPITVEFDEDVWAAIDTIEAGVTTFIQADISSLSTYTGVHPLTVGWRPSSASGCIFYTSYHVEGASTGAAQELAIKYLVQNIGTVCQ